MAATVAQSSVKTPFPSMTPAETEEFREAVAMLRTERALYESAAAGSAAILAASGPAS